LDKLTGAIKKNLGKSWAQLYQKEFGKLADFVTKNEPFLTLEERTKVVRLKDVRYRSVSLEIFTREYTEMTPPEQAPSSSTPPNQIDEDEKYAMMIQEEESLETSGEAGEEEKESSSTWHSKTKKSRRQRNKETAKALKKTQENVTVTIGGKKNESTPAAATAEAAVPVTPTKLDLKEGNTPEVSTPSSQPTPSGQSHNQDPSPTAAEDSEDDLLIQLLLNEFHGKFYCFNDSEVRPIFLTDLCNAFEGKSSAYLLIYRKLDMGELSVFGSSNLIDLEHSPQLLTQQPNKYSHLLQLRSYLHNTQRTNHTQQEMEQEITEERDRLIDPPTYWKQKIDSLNLSLQTRRQEFDVMMKSLTLKVFLPEHFLSDWPCLHFKSPDGNGNGNGLRMPIAWYHGIEIECDMSKTVTQICEEIWFKMIEVAQNEKKLPFLGNLLGLPSNWQTLQLSFHLSEIILCPKLSNERSSSSSSSSCSSLSRYFIKTPPSGDMLIKEIFSHQSRVLLYCQGYQQLPPPFETAAIEIMETPPKELIITYAAGDSLISTNLTSTHIYLPQSLQLHPLCQYICSYLGISSVQHIHLYLIQERKLSHNTRTTVNSLSSGLGSQNAAAGKSKEYYATSLWKSGLISRGIQQGLSFGQLEGCEIIVENLSSVKKSSPNSGLAHQEITRRNRLRTIRIDLENSGSLLQLQKDYSLGGKMFPMQMQHEDDGMSIVDPSESETTSTPAAAAAAVASTAVSEDHQESVLSTQVKVSFLSFSLLPPPLLMLL
jgi:hypothetical protein